MSSSSVTVLPTNENYNNSLAWSTSAAPSFSEISSITSEEISSLKSAVGDLWVMKEIDFSMIEKFVYDGFDYEALFKALALIKRKRNFTDSVMQDLISKALAIHQLTGNVSTRRFTSMSGPGKEIVNTTISSLNIKVGKSSSLTRYDLTFPRLGALFPFPLSVIADRFPKDFASKYGTTGLPSYMKTSSFPSLIPAGHPYSTLLLKAYEAYSIDMTIALRGKDPLTIPADELTAIIKSQQRFIGLSHASGVLSPSLRIRAMRALRVDNSETYAKLKSVAENYGATGLPTATEWSQMFIASYATVLDSSGAPSLPLPGKALAPASERKESEEERLAREAREKAERDDKEDSAPSAGF